MHINAGRSDIFLRPINKYKETLLQNTVKGLYLVGASTFPGVEAVVISGIICANDINKWKMRK